MLAGWLTGWRIQFVSMMYYDDAGIVSLYSYTTTSHTAAITQCYEQHIFPHSEHIYYDDMAPDIEF